MFGSLLRLLAGCTVLVAGGWAAHAADPPVDADFVFWQDRLLGRESGIYENGDSVFVVSRVPVSSRTRIRAKEAALLESSSLLRNWAFEQARRDRGAEPARPADIAAMAVFNDKHSPGWRIPPWRIDALGRQLPTRESDGFLHQAQVYDRETLLRAIPDGYRRHPADDETATAFATIAQAAFRRDPESFSASVSGLSGVASLDAGAVAEAALRHEAEERHDLALASALLAFGATRDETIRTKVAHLLEETQP